MVVWFQCLQTENKYHKQTKQRSLTIPQMGLHYPSQQQILWIDIDQHQGWGNSFSSEWDRGRRNLYTVEKWLEQLNYMIKYISSSQTKHILQRRFYTCRKKKPGLAHKSILTGQIIAYSQTKSMLMMALYSNMTLHNEEYIPMITLIRQLRLLESIFRFFRPIL